MRFLGVFEISRYSRSVTVKFGYLFVLSSLYLDHACRLNEKLGSYPVRFTKARNIMLYNKKKTLQVLVHGDRVVKWNFFGVSMTLNVLFFFVQIEPTTSMTLIRCGKQVL